jgi:uncharacterized protein (TIGR02217 family)
MVSFVDDRLPGALEQGAQGGPMYNTSVVTTQSGFEQRNANWQFPRYKWNLTIPYGDQDLFDDLVSFFHARSGRLVGFRFHDPADYTAVAEPIWHDTVNGVWRLAKTYTSGSVALVRRITKPINGTVTFTGGGTLNYSTGIIAGNSGGTWTGQFDVPVRFDTDQFNLTMEQIDVGSASIDIIELRE